MDEYQSSRKRKVIIFLAVTAVVMGVIIIGSILLLGKPDNSYRVVGLISLPTLQEKPSDFKNSELNIYENGTFDVQIIYKNDVHFVGLGTFTKKSNSYVFFYIDSTRPGYINAEHEYQILKNDRIRFELDGKYYTFGK